MRRVSLSWKFPHKRRWYWYLILSEWQARPSRWRNPRSCMLFWRKTLVSWKMSWLPVITRRLKMPTRGNWPRWKGRICWKCPRRIWFRRWPHWCRVYGLWKITSRGPIRMRFPRFWSGGRIPSWPRIRRTWIRLWLCWMGLRFRYRSCMTWIFTILGRWPCWRMLLRRCCTGIKLPVALSWWRERKWRNPSLAWVIISRLISAIRIWHPCVCVMQNRSWNWNVWPGCTMKWMGALIRRITTSWIISAGVFTRIGHPSLYAGLSRTIIRWRWPVGETGSSTGQAGVSGMPMAWWKGITVGTTGWIFLSRIT